MKDQAQYLKTKYARYEVNNLSSSTFLIYIMQKTTQTALELCGKKLVENRTQPFLTILWNGARPVLCHNTVLFMGVASSISELNI